MSQITTVSQKVLQQMRDTKHGVERSAQGVRDYPQSERNVSLRTRVGRAGAYNHAFPSAAGANTYEVKFGELSFDDSLPGSTLVTFTPYSPDFIRIARTLDGSPIEENEYVIAILCNKLWFIMPLGITDVRVDSGMTKLQKLKNGSWLDWANLVDC